MCNKIKERDARNRGMDDYEEGASIFDNPYSREQKDLREAWDDGYDYAAFHKS